MKNPFTNSSKTLAEFFRIEINIQEKKIVWFSQIQDGRINLISQEADLNYSKEIFTKCLERATDKTSQEESIQVLEESKDESDSVCTYWKR